MDYNYNDNKMSFFCRNDSVESDSSHIVFQNSGNSLESEVSDGVKDVNKSPTSSPVRLKGRNNYFDDMRYRYINYNCRNKN